MKIPLKKDHVEGKYQVAMFIRLADGGTMEFTSKRPLDINDPLTLSIRCAFAQALNIDPEDIK